MHFEFDATFWALVGLVIFLGIMVWLKVPGQIGKSLDNRADKIRNELDEARRFREEAAELLADYQRRRAEAEAEASQIVAAARQEADLVARDGAAKMAEFVIRRTAMAEQKIAQAEAQAISAVKASVVDIAVAAAGKLIAAKAKGRIADDLVARSIAEVKTRLN